VGLRTPERAARVPAGVEHAEGSFAGQGGIKLFEQSWKPVGASKGVLVVVHGLKDHSARYQDFAEEAVRRGYAVYAFDLRGHGRSEGFRVYTSSFDDYLADLGIFMKRVREKEPGATPFLFGHSMGGAIATLYAETRDPQLAGLVLSAPALRHQVGDVDHAFLDLTSALFPYTGVLSLVEEDFTRDPEALAAMQHDPLIHHESGPARTAAELLSAIGRIRGWFDGIHVPVLVIHGDSDRVTMPEGSEDLIAGARSTPDRTIWRCEGLYHDLLHEPEHGALTDAIVGWLESRREGPRAWLHATPPAPCRDATPVSVIPPAPTDAPAP